MADGTLKPGWRRVRFGDVVRLNTERVADPAAAGLERYVGLDHIEPEDLRIRRWGLVADGTTFNNRFRPGQVLFGKRRAYQRKVAVADFDGVCSGDIYVFESKDSSILLPDLLPFLCQTEGFFEHAVGTSAGSLSPRTNWTQLAKYEFALPPLEEQAKYAATLKAASAVKASLQSLGEAAQQTWNSVAVHLFTQARIVERQTGRDRLRLGDLLHYGSDGPFGSKLKTVHYGPDGARVIRLQNIQRRHFDDTDKAFISAEYYQSDLSGYTVRPGDVLVAGLGDDNIEAGRACIAPDYLGPAINKADCYCLRPVEELNARYLVAFLNSVEGIRQSLSFAQGTTRYRLNLTNIRRMQLPVPDLAYQIEIAGTLDGLYGTELDIQGRLIRQQHFITAQINSSAGGGYHAHSS